MAYDADFDIWTPDNLLIRGPNVRQITVLSGEVVARGDVLGKVTASGKYLMSASAAGDGSETPLVIAAEPIDASGGDVEGLVYESGTFNQNAVTLGEGHSLSDIREGLREKGIFLIDVEQAVSGAVLPGNYPEDDALDQATLNARWTFDDASSFDDATGATVALDVDQYVVFQVNWADAVPVSDQITDLTGNHTVTLPTGEYSITAAGLVKTTDTEVTTPDSDDWHFGTGDWCVEFFYDKTQGEPAQYYKYIGQYVTTGNQRAWIVQNNTSSTDIWVSSNGDTRTSITAADLAAGVTHVAVVSHSGTVQIFLDGKRKDSTSWATIHNSTGGMGISARGTYLAHRITKGHSRYGNTLEFTAPTSFDPPTTYVGYKVTIPSGNAHDAWDTFAGAGIYQARANSGAFDVTVKVSDYVDTDSAWHGWGICAWQDPTDWVYAGCVNDGSGWDRRLTYALGGTSGSAHDEEMEDPASEYFIRLAFDGTDTWNSYDSHDGKIWTRRGINYTQAMEVNRIWLFALNSTANPATNVTFADFAKHVESGFNRMIVASSDDAEEQIVAGTGDITSTDLELGNEGGFTKEVGLRFTNVSVAKDAEIVDAWLQFVTDEAQVYVLVDLSIEGEAADNAATFTGASDDLGNRSRTSALQGWSPPEWNTVMSAYSDQRTPSIRNIVQEIVSRSGWSSGNAMSFFVTQVNGVGSRIAEAYDGENNRCTQLHIETGTRNDTFPKDDVFAATTLDTGIWTFTDESGNDNGTYSMEQPGIKITAPSGTSHGFWGGNSSVWVHQDASDEKSLDVVVKVDSYESTAGVAVKTFGIMAGADSSNQALVGFSWDGSNWYHRFTKTVSGVSSNPVYAIASVESYLRLSYDASTSNWTARKSTNGVTWTLIASHTQAFTINQIGLFVANGTSNPEIWAVFQDFKKL